MRTILKLGIAFGMFLLMLRLSSYSQVSINTDNSQPDSSAMLDIKSNNKGFLPPRISLSSINSSNPITSPAIGLLIYNIATTGSPPNNVIPGFYYWNGTQWISLTLPQGIQIGQMLYWNGTLWNPRIFWLNVLDFGADNTGATDATSAIQNAINAADEGGTIYFPHGRYKTHGGLVISKRLDMLGEAGILEASIGNDTTGSVITCTSDTATLLKVNAFNCSFRNIVFLNTATTTRTAGTGVYLYNAGVFRMEDCSIQEFYDDMVVRQSEFFNIVNVYFAKAKHWELRIFNTTWTGSGDNNITRCTFMASSNTALANIRWESNPGLKITLCKFTQNDETGIPYHIDIPGLTAEIGQLIISDCSFEPFATAAIYIHPANNVAVSNFQINNCYFAPGNNLISGAIYAIKANTDFYGITISNNVFHSILVSQNNPAISAIGVTGIMVRDNVFAGWPKKIELINCANVDTLTTFGIIAPNFTLMAGDTSEAVKGRSVFISADSSYYDCRGTTGAHKWWKRKY